MEGRLHSLVAQTQEPQPVRRPACVPQVQQAQSEAGGLQEQAEAETAETEVRWGWRCGTVPRTWDREMPGAGTAAGTQQGTLAVQRGWHRQTPLTPSPRPAPRCTAQDALLDLRHAMDLLKSLQDSRGSVLSMLWESQAKAEAAGAELQAWRSQLAEARSQLAAGACDIARAQDQLEAVQKQESELGKQLEAGERRREQLQLAQRDGAARMQAAGAELQAATRTVSKARRCRVLCPPVECRVVGTWMRSVAAGREQGPGRGRACACRGRWPPRA